MNSGRLRVAALVCLLPVRHFVVVATLALAVSCGGSKSPATPTPTPVTLAGFIFNALLGPTARVAGARVIISGTGAGRVTTSDSQGAYRFETLERGSLTLRVSGAGFVTGSQFVSINGNVEAGVGLAPDRVAASGITVDALTEARLGNVTVTGGESLVTSDAAGAFTVTAASSMTVVTPLIFSSPFTVERRTSLRLPGPEATASLLSTTFDLAAFNQMFRMPSLQRWTTAPPVLLEMRAATFVDRGADDVTLNDIVMSDAEATSILSDLTRALPQLSGGKFPAFASVGRQTSARRLDLPSAQFRGHHRHSRDWHGESLGVIGLAQILRFSDGRISGGMII